MPRTKVASTDTAQRILDVAERLIQTRGFNGFSYADVAETLGITKASLHYHFATKMTLGERVVERYEQRFLDALADIDRSETTARAKLQRYASIYVDVLRNNRMCLCGMLASDYTTLAKSLKASIRHFFDRNEAWLVAVLTQGRQAGMLHFKGLPEIAASSLLGALEGAMMIARTYGDVPRFQAVTERLLAEF